MTESMDPAQPHIRIREGGIATLFLLAAMLAMYLITRIDVVRLSPQHGLYLVTVALFALSVPGPLVRLWDVPGQLLFWNAMGWGMGLALFGLASVGAMPILPLILAGFAISFWPRDPERTLPAQAVAIVLLGGLAVCWISWGEIAFDLPFWPADEG
jgi:hypothetical protein